jgi:hypothetical protein
MAERTVPDITFESFKRTAMRPADVTEDRWRIGMTVTRTLFELGSLTEVIEEGHCGPNMPVQYLIKGNSTEAPVIVRHAPHWAYATVVTATGRENVNFYDDRNATRAQIIVDLKHAIRGKQERRSTPSHFRKIVKKFW